MAATGAVVSETEGVKMAAEIQNHGGRVNLKIVRCRSQASLTTRMRPTLRHLLSSLTRPVSKQRNWRRQSLLKTQKTPHEGRK